MIPGPTLAAAGGALILLGLTELAVRLKVGRPPVVLNAGPARAMRYGALTLLTFAVLIWPTWIAAGSVHEGRLVVVEELRSPWGWLGVAPLLALGMAGLATGLRQLLRGRPGYAGTAIGGLILGAFIFFVEQAGALSLGRSGVVATRGTLAQRTVSAPASDVEYIAVVTGVYKGARSYTVELAGDSLPETAKSFKLMHREVAEAHTLADEWARAAGWPVREVAER